MPAEEMLPEIVTFKYCETFNCKLMAKVDRSALAGFLHSALGHTVQVVQIFNEFVNENGFIL